MKILNVVITANVRCGVYLTAENSSFGFLMKKEATNAGVLRISVGGERLKKTAE